MKNALTNICLLLGSLLFFFGGIEFALRVTGIVAVKPNPPKIYQKSSIPEIGYELKPNISLRAYRATVTTNSLGFRSQEIDPDRPLIAVIGDSIAFGYGVEDSETIPARLQRLLPRHTILNAGVPGYNLVQQRTTYREKLQKLHPSALILLFHFNDVEETNMNIAELDSDGILRPQGWKPQAQTCSPITAGLFGLLPGKCWLDQHSALYVALKKYLNARQAQEDLREQEYTYRTDPFAENIRDESLERYAVELHTLRQLLPRNLPRLFIIWPERHLHLVARPKLKEIAQKEGFQLLDLYEVFGNHPQTLSWDNVHPSPATNAEAADVIAAALEHDGLLP
ncbi:SGNH/GDSL hydrolase family protein [Candidatus Peregrinibacteria bacterium]|nr:SGNH/GDSL hydrolase family protein [Candidatus Peregrinibacteria bacterium]